MLVNSLAGGGAETVVLLLYGEYCKSEADVSLVCLEQPDHRNEISCDSLAKDKGGPAGSIVKFLRLFSLAIKLKKKVAKEGIDLVQSHIYRANFVNVLARMLGAQHQVQLVNHGMPSQYKKQGFAGKLSLMLVRRLYPRADQVICPSAAMLGELEALGVPAERLKIIANPSDIHSIDAKATQTMAEEKYHFRPDRKTVIVMGRLQAVKRVQDVISAVAQLRREDQTVDLLVVGSGPEQNHLEELARKLGIASQVHFLGWQENPYPCLAQADIYISSSETEGFSNTIVEALALGVPVIATHCPGGPTEILLARQDDSYAVQLAEFGLLVPVGDSEAMATAIARLLRDQILAGSFRKKGQQRARDFDLPGIAMIYLDTMELGCAA